MHHADLRREATAVIAKPASAVLYDTRYCCVVPGTGVWACGCVFCGWMSDAMGSNIYIYIPGKLFRLSFSTGRSSQKSQVFRLDPTVGKLSRKKLSRKTQSEKVEPKKPFPDCVRKPDSGFSRKRPKKAVFDGQIRLCKKWSHHVKQYSTQNLDISYRM